MNAHDTNKGWHGRSFEKEYVDVMMKCLMVNDFAPESCSSLDLHVDQGLLPNYSLLLSVAHDEYWSREMRDNVEEFIASGGNVAFFSANTCLQAAAMFVSVDKYARAVQKFCDESADEKT